MPAPGRERYRVATNWRDSPRNNVTERPITVQQGTNRLVGNRPEAIVEGVVDALRNCRSASKRPDLWDGKAASRIVDVIEKRF